MKDLNSAMEKGAVIIFGPPGAGKTTQATLLEKKTGFITFNTGGMLERIVHDPQKQDDPYIQKQKEYFDSGELMDPPFVLDVISTQIQAHAQQGEGLVFGSNPRKMEEAFGTEKQQGLFHILQSVFPQNHILIIEIQVPPEVSIQRNSQRKVCSVCETPVINPELLKGIDNLYQCTLCGGELHTRTLDKPEIITVRLDAYKKETLPIIEKLRKQNYPYHSVSGEALPYKIHNEIYTFVYDSLKK